MVISSESLIAIRSNDPEITELDLSSLVIGSAEEDIDNLGKALRSNSNIATFNFSHDSIDESIIKFLLGSIDVGRNPESSHVIPVSYQRKQQHSLVGMMRKPIVHSDMAKELNKAKPLEMMENILENEDKYEGSTSENSSKNTLGISLNLSCNRLQDDGVEVILPYLKKLNIVSLILTNNGITDNGVESLVKAMRSVDVNLKSLDISNQSYPGSSAGILNRLTKESGHNFIALLDNNKDVTLRNVNLAGTGVSMGQFSKIQEYLLELGEEDKKPSRTLASDSVSKTLSSSVCTIS